MDAKKIKLGVIAFIVMILLMFGKQFYVSIPAGNVGVATLFGDVQQNIFAEGLHVPVNPLYKWHIYDVREKTHMETAQVPSQDQLQTKLEVNVQFRIIGSEAANLLRNTGDFNQMLRVHLVPKFRSLLREQGKTIKRAEDFFLEKTQENLQAGILSGLTEFMAPKGVEVTAILIRNITLPPFITKAIESKKEREQAVERERAELLRVETELQQKVAKAVAEKKAAMSEAEQIRVLADATAYKITKINEAIASNQAYIKLQALEALKSISKDPASKVYFINGDSPNPLPLMHIGEK